MQIRAVIFDYDEVIARTDRFHEYAVGGALQQRALPFNHDWYMRCFFGRNLRAGFAEYFREIRKPLHSLEKLVAAKKAFDVEYEQWVTPHEGALDFIACVRGKVPLAVASGTRRTLCNIGLKKLDLSDVFTVVVTSEDYERSKPAPDAFLAALDALNRILGLNVQPEEVAVIEDSPLGVDAAKAARMFCVAVTYTHSADQLTRANLIVTDLRDLDVSALNVITS